MPTTIGSMDRVWRCRDRELALAAQTLVMGIVNVTPDSFSDGGLFEDAEAAVRHGLRLLEEGADVLDVGGVRAGPGDDVSPQQELDRVVGFVAAVRERHPGVVV